MLLKFWPSENARILLSRRGINGYRIADVPPNATSFEYQPLPDCVVELIENRKVTGIVEVSANTMGVVNVTPTAAHVANACDWLKTPHNESVQSLGREQRDIGQTLSGADVVQVPSLDAGNARLGSSEEHRPEVGADGLHSSNDAPSVLHNRSTEGVSSVSSTIEDTGRDELLEREIRSSTGNESVPTEPVLGREERGDEKVGVSNSVYRWQQQS